jgi:hypothetical protein
MAFVPLQIQKQQRLQNPETDAALLVTISIGDFQHDSEKSDSFSSTLSPNTASQLSQLASHFASNDSVELVQSDNLPASSTLSPRTASQISQLATHFDVGSKEDNKIMVDELSSTASPSSSPPASPFSHSDNLDELSPLRAAEIQCCRCDNTQPLYDDEPSVCEKCTKAACQQCKISSQDVVVFSKDSKAIIPKDSIVGSYWWFCHNCGTLREIPTSKVRQLGKGMSSVDLKSLACAPCNQKASKHTLCIATLNISPFNTPEEQNLASRNLPRQRQLDHLSKGLGATDETQRIQPFRSQSSRLTIRRPKAWTERMVRRLTSN